MISLRATNSDTSASRLRDLSDDALIAAWRAAPVLSSALQEISVEFDRRGVEEPFPW